MIKEHQLIFSIFIVGLIICVGIVIFEEVSEISCEKEEFVVEGIKSIDRNYAVYETNKGDVVYYRGYIEGETFERCKK